MKIVESKKRMLLKSITFRILILTADGIIVYAITRELNLALTVTVVRNIVAMGLYYLHENYWNSVQWGFTKKKK